MDMLTPTVDFEQNREDWNVYVEHIVDELAAWLTSHSGQPGISRGENEVVEQNLDRYSLPSLEATFGDQYITVESRGETTGRGSMVITAWPNLRRVYLVRVAGASQPKVYTESRIPLHEEWNEANFHRLIDDLLADA